MSITSCRYCGFALTPILTLGSISPVNYFPTTEEISKVKRYPLNLVYCDSCGLLQLDEIVPASEIFQTYHYVTGASKPLVHELSELATELINTRNLAKHHRVLDIGSNDGTLLSFFRAKGIQSIGVEPSHELSKASSARGINTLNTFFSLDVAKKIVETYGLCDVVSATHVLANIVDLHDFMSGIHTVLSPNGVCVIEVADAESMIGNGQFDSIYHEHYSYFTAAMLSRLAVDHGLEIVSLSHSTVQGGALRITMQHAKHKKTTIEPVTKLTDISAFAKKVNTYTQSFQHLIAKYKGKTMIGFGAPAKSVTFTSVIGMNEKQIRYIVDSTAQKQGRYLPGTAIPILPESHISQDPPDVVIVFSWNYREAIIAKLKLLLHPETIVVFPFPRLEELRPKTE